MVGVSCDETMSERACGLGLMCAAAGLGASAAKGCGVCARSFAACDMCWPERMSGSGTLPVSRLWDTVVILARRGRRNVGGRVARDSSKALRADRAKRAMLTCAMAWLPSGILLRWSCGVWQGNARLGKLAG